MNLYTIAMVFLLVFRSFKCNENIHETVHKKVLELKAKQIEMYGEPRKISSNRFDDASVEYPRNDKDKLSEISRIWLDYYECLLHLAQSLTESNQFPNTALRVYTESVARIPCNLCVSPAEVDQITWMYASSIKNLSFVTLKATDTMVGNNDLTVYHTRFEDAGVYQCRLGDSFSGLVILEVMDKEPYTLVKSKPSHGVHSPSPPLRVSRDAIIFTSWSPWSECSRCDAVGRRRRYGICYVGLIDSNKYKITQDAAQSDTHRSLDNETAHIMRAFPNGIPCRSDMLPPSMRGMTAVGARRNEIMIGLCKVPCKNDILEIRSQTGVVLDRVNNTDGIYSLYQRRPLQPPEVVRDIIFVSPGDGATIRCPGTILRDIPVIWRKGTEVLSRDLVVASDGRAYFDARDHIVFKFVQYMDADVYSCWQDGILAGVVKLIVRNKPETVYKRRFALTAAIIIVAVTLRAARRYLRYRQRQIMY